MLALSVRPNICKKRELELLLFFSGCSGSYLHVVHRLTALVGVLGVPEQHKGHALTLAGLWITEDRYPENACVQISQKGAKPTCLCRLPHYRTVLFKDLPQIDVGQVERQVGHVRRVPDGIACDAAHDFDFCLQTVCAGLFTNKSVRISKRTERTVKILH